MRDLRILLVDDHEAVARGEALLDPAMMNKAFARLREAARKERGELRGACQALDR